MLMLRYPLRPQQNVTVAGPFVRRKIGRNQAKMVYMGENKTKLR